MIIITAIRNYSKREVTYGKSIDYKNISVEQLLENFNEDYSDRDDYLVISNIINELKKNSDDSGKYYEALDYYYSKRISKSKFKKSVNELFERVGNSSYSIKLYKEKSTSNTYIAEIVGEEQSGYIGIILNSNSSTYNIFYIE